MYVYFTVQSHSSTNGLHASRHLVIRVPRSFVSIKTLTLVNSKYRKRSYRIVTEHNAKFPSSALFVPCVWRTSRASPHNETNHDAITMVGAATEWKRSKSLKVPRSTKKRYFVRSHLDRHYCTINAERSASPGPGENRIQCRA